MISKVLGSQHFKNNALILAFMTAFVSVPPGYAVPAVEKTADHQTLPGIDVPEESAFLLDAWQPDEPSDKDPVYYLLDVHAHPAAQFSASRILHWLAENHGVEMALVEGAEGLCEPELFAAGLEYSIVRTLADLYVQEAIFTGAEHYALTGNSSVRLWGIEDLQTQRANLEAYKRTAEIKTLALPVAEDLLDRLHALRRIVYPQALNELYAHRSAYESGSESLYAWVNILIEGANASGITLDKYPAIRLIHRTKILEEQMDAALVRQGVQRWLKLLYPMLAESDKVEIRKLMTGVRVGEVESQHLYKHIGDLVHTQGQELINTLPQIQSDLRAALDYFELINAKKSLRLGSIGEETDQLFHQIESKLAVSERQSQLAVWLRFFETSVRLIKLELTVNDWQWYQENHELANATAIENGLPQLLAEHGDVSSSKGRTLLHALRHAEEFYELAVSRDAVMAANILEQLQQNPGPAFVVTGGFHAEGIKEHLRKASIPYYVLAPKFEGDPDRAVYRDRLMMDYPDYAQLSRQIPESALTPELITAPSNPARGQFLQTHWQLARRLGSGLLTSLRNLMVPVVVAGVVIMMALPMSVQAQSIPITPSNPIIQQTIPAIPGAPSEVTTVMEIRPAQNQIGNFVLGGLFMVSNTAETGLALSDGAGNYAWFVVSPGQTPQLSLVMMGQNTILREFVLDVILPGGSEINFASVVQAVQASDVDLRAVLSGDPSFIEYPVLSVDGVYQMPYVVQSGDSLARVVSQQLESGGQADRQGLIDWNRQWDASFYLEPLETGDWIFLPAVPGVASEFGRMRFSGEEVGTSYGELMTTLNTDAEEADAELTEEAPTEEINRDDAQTAVPESTEDADQAAVVANATVAAEPSTPPTPSLTPTPSATPTADALSAAGLNATGLPADLDPTIEAPADSQAVIQPAEVEEDHEGDVHLRFLPESWLEWQPPAWFWIIPNVAGGLGMAFWFWFNNRRWQSEEEEAAHDDEHVHSDDEHTHEHDEHEGHDHAAHSHEHHAHDDHRHLDDAEPVSVDGEAPSWRQVANIVPTALAMQLDPLYQSNGAISWMTAPANGQFAQRDGADLAISKDLWLAMHADDGARRAVAVLALAQAVEPQQMKAVVQGMYADSAFHDPMHELQNWAEAGQLETLVRHGLQMNADFIAAPVIGSIQQTIKDAHHSHGDGKQVSLIKRLAATALFGLILWSTWEIAVVAIERVAMPVAIVGPGAFGIAMVGLVVNLWAVTLLTGNMNKDDPEIQALYAHILGDVLGSFAAMGSAILVMVTGIWGNPWLWSDPALSFMVGFLLLRMSVELGKNLVRSFPFVKNTLQAGVFASTQLPMPGRMRLQAAQFGIALGADEHNHDHDFKLQPVIASVLAGIAMVWLFSDGAGVLLNPVFHALPFVAQGAMALGLYTLVYSLIYRVLLDTVLRNALLKAIESPKIQVLWNRSGADRIFELPVLHGLKHRMEGWLGLEDSHGHHDHDHDHDHNHEDEDGLFHSHGNPASVTLIGVLFLTFTFFIVEHLGGHWFGSHALEADSYHMIKDVAAQAIVLASYWLPIIFVGALGLIGINLGGSEGHSDTHHDHEHEHEHDHDHEGLPATGFIALDEIGVRSANGVGPARLNGNGRMPHPAGDPGHDHEFAGLPQTGFVALGEIGGGAVNGFHAETANGNGRLPDVSSDGVPLATPTAADVAEMNGHLNGNRAAEQWAGIEGIGPVLSSRLTAHIASRGIASINQVPSIGPIRTARVVQAVESEAAEELLESLNTETREELMQLPGIGGILADRIILLREEATIDRLEQLLMIRGIGLKTILNLVRHLSRHNRMLSGVDWLPEPELAPPPNGVHREEWEKFESST